MGLPSDRRGDRTPRSDNKKRSRPRHAAASPEAGRPPILCGPGARRCPGGRQIVGAAARQVKGIERHRPAKTSTTTSTAKTDPVEAEDGHRARPEPRQQEADRQQPGDRRGGEARRDGEPLDPGVSLGQELARAVEAGAERDRRRQQEAEARRRLASRPSASPAVIVAPERLMPGQERQAWLRPMVSAVGAVTSSRPRFGATEAVGQPQRAAPTTRKPAIARRAASVSPWNVSSMKSSSAKPMSAAGIVASDEEPRHRRSGSAPMRRSRRLATPRRCSAASRGRSRRAAPRACRGGGRRRTPASRSARSSPSRGSTARARGAPRS